MRGKVDLSAQVLIRKRITPAYAGKSQTASPCTCSTRDHPRLCGEKAYYVYHVWADSGSPPPMRGKGYQVVTSAVSTRITPAYAGKSTPIHFPVAIGKDHPRLCGEKTKKIPKQRYFFHQPASFSFSLQYT